MISYAEFLALPAEYRAQMTREAARIRAGADPVPQDDEPVRIVKTSHVYPPIPWRGNDWCAWFDDEGEEAGRYGWGATEAEAIADLHENYGEGA